MFAFIALIVVIYFVFNWLFDKLPTKYFPNSYKKFYAGFAISAVVSVAAVPTSALIIGLVVAIAIDLMYDYVLKVMINRIAATFLSGVINSYEAKATV